MSNLNMVFLTHPVDTEHEDIVDDKPDGTERNGDVVPDVKSCIDTVVRIIIIIIIIIYLRTQRTSRYSSAYFLLIIAINLVQLRMVRVHKMSECFYTLSIIGLLI